MLATAARCTTTTFGRSSYSRFDTMLLSGACATSSTAIQSRLHVGMENTLTNTAPCRGWQSMHSTRRSSMAQTTATHHTANCTMLTPSRTSRCLLAQGDAYRKLFAGQVIQDPPVGDINALEFLRRAVDRRWISHAQLDPTFFLQRPVAHASEPTISARCFRVLLHQLLDRHWHTAVGLQQCTAMPATVMALALVG